MPGFGTRGSGLVVIALAMVVGAGFSRPVHAQASKRVATGTNRPAHKQDVNHRYPDGSTPLQWAFYPGDVAEATRLLRAGAYVSLAYHYGATPPPDTGAYYRVTARSSSPTTLNGRSIVVLQSTVKRGM